MNDENKEVTTVTTRQKIIGLVGLVIVGVLIWQVIGMFGGPSEEEKKLAAAPKPFNPITDQKPQPVKVAEVPIASPEQQAIWGKMEQEAQQRYVKVVNELEMLKLTQQLVETNKDIVTAKFATVKAQKDIVDLLTPKPQPKTAQQNADGAPSITSDRNAVLMAPNNISIGQAVGAGAAPAPTLPGENLSNEQPKHVEPKIPIANYSAVSVTQLLSRWNAVLRLQGKLFSVYVGDVLPDGATVVDINKSSVILEREGEQKKISLVPII